MESREYTETRATVTEATVPAAVHTWCRHVKETLLLPPHELQRPGLPGTISIDWRLYDKIEMSKLCWLLAMKILSDG